jgi:hypothetical protein
MRFTKKMTINMTIKNTADIFSGEPIQMLLASFNREYAGFCIGGSFVEMGKRILRTGLIECNIDGESCYVPIEIECDVINYEIGEIVVAQVYKILQDGTIFLKTSNAVITLKSNLDTRGISPNQYIPVVVENSVYAPFKQITISATMLRPMARFHTFIIDDSNIDDSRLSEISELTEKLNTLGKKHPKADKFFRNLLTTPPSKKEKLVDIFQIKNLKPGMIVSRGPEYSSHFYTYSNKTAMTIPLSATLVANILIAHVHIDLLNICTLIENFDEIEKADFIWKTYQQKSK